MDQTKPQDQSISGQHRECGDDANNGRLVRVFTPGLSKIPIEVQQKPSANNTIITTESVYQAMLAQPFATAQSKWRATATAQTRAGAKLSGTAVTLTPFFLTLIEELLGVTPRFSAKASKVGLFLFVLD